MAIHKKENIILEKTFYFAVKCIHFYQEMNQAKEYVLSKQLLRAGTSIGANVQEAQAAQSRKDFISKMTIAAKEARETRYWLALIKHSNICQSNLLNELYDDIKDILNILYRIIKTSQGSNNS